ncbi:MAG: hypothetical protein U1E63_06865 [Burkholderiales bacterium]
MTEIPAYSGAGTTGTCVWSRQNGQSAPPWAADGVFEDPTSSRTRLVPYALQIATHAALPEAASTRETVGATTANTIAQRAIHAAGTQRGERDRRMAMSWSSERLPQRVLLLNSD